MDSKSITVPTRKLLVDMFINFDSELPGSDDIEEIRAKFVKRGRAEMVSVVEQKGKKRKS